MVSGDARPGRGRGTGDLGQASPPTTTAAPTPAGPITTGEVQQLLVAVARLACQLGQVEQLMMAPEPVD